MLETAEFKHQKELESRNKKLIQSYWDGKWNKRSPEILNELQTPDVVYHGTSMTMKGIEAYKEVYKGYLSASKSSSVEIQDLLADGDKIMSCVKLHSLQKAEPGESLSNEKEISINIFTIFRLDHGKIAEEWEIMDELGMMQQLGMELRMKE